MPLAVAGDQVTRLSGSMLSSLYFQNDTNDTRELFDAEKLITEPRTGDSGSEDRIFALYLELSCSTKLSLLLVACFEPPHSPTDKFSFHGRWTFSGDLKSGQQHNAIA